MGNEPLITILMATYNGERYLEQQLDSLLNQTYTHWEMLIRDDGSTDGTLRIIERYKNKHANISYIVNQTDKKGACLNFAALFASVVKDDKVKYVMFCDQDDIWKPQKIEMSVVAMLDT